MESNRSSLYLFTGVVIVTFLMAVVLTVVYVNVSPGGAVPNAVAQVSNEAGAPADGAQASQPAEGDDAAQADAGDSDMQDAAEGAGGETQQAAAAQEADASGGDEASESGASEAEGSAAESGAGSEASGGATDPNVTIEDGVQVVTITGNDQMQYNINEFRVKAGQPIRIVFENVGSFPKQAMGHNVVVLDQGVSHAAFAQKGVQYAQQGYIPQGDEAQEQMVAHTKLLGPGESDTIEFTIDKPGTYPYVCTFPAHFATMNGKMIVEPAGKASGESDGSGKEMTAEKSGDGGGADKAAASGGLSSIDSNVTIEDGVQVITITGNDQMQYNINEFKVKAGHPVRIVFENVGSFPKQAMGHNVVVLDQGVSHAAFAQKGVQHAQQGYIPQGDAAQEQMVAHTKLLGPGESDTIEFTVDEAGEYPYVCTFPAHFATMNGKMIVEE